ncbi:sigma-70 family RNA polymerase sigma factor [uncultured Anaerococcus sp.]|uniref:sigma-70 family RNA polymerase sigma factor n=1 Tax=uncultured Anaerococcus sp. TaxID=293428 RepID=UPI002889AC85|nr:sigma-70 family RNA polymerase sigma factor [uncultured Anaerococcus sp.]
MDERRIIDGIKIRDEKRLIEFIDVYGKIMKASIVKTIGSRNELVEEVLNDSLLAIWDNIDSFDETRSSFKNRCAGLAKYKAIDCIRRENRHKTLALDRLSEPIAYEEDFDLDEAEEILELLSDKDREIFVKLFLEGYKYEDLEKETRLSKERLYNKVSRTKKNLRLKLGGTYE